MILTMNGSFPGPSKPVEQKKDYLPKISSLTPAQLLELLERQKKILSSPAVSKLPDKGEKVKKLKHQIEDELLKRNKTVDICNELENLSLQERKIEVIEWGEGKIDQEDKLLADKDPSADENNPVAILATHSGTVLNKRQIRVEETDEPLVTLADIEEAYALSLSNKIDKTARKDRFLPNKTVKNCTAPTKSRDLSAATPPAPVFGDVKFISLEESIRLQYDQTKHLKEVQMRHATERLKESHSYRIGRVALEGESAKAYRDQGGSEGEQASEDEISEDE